MTKAGPQVASIHTHFNIFRNPHDARSGEVTLEEQIKAATRFLKWHARQVEVGQKLLKRLLDLQQSPDPIQEEPFNGPSGV